MVDNLIDAFYKELPAVICTAGSYISAANPAAISRLRRFSEGEILFDFMAPADVLKFAARFHGSVRTDSLTFPLYSFHGYKYGTAVFEELMGRRFAVVFLSRQNSNSEDIAEYIATPVPRQGSHVKRFLDTFLSIDISHFEDADRVGIIDVKTLTRTALKTLSRTYPFSDCSIELFENDEMRSSLCMTLDIAESLYLQMLILIIRALNEITLERRIKVGLYRYGERCSIHVTVDAARLSCTVSDLDSLIGACPQSSVYLSIADYVAGICGCDITVSVTKDMDELSIVLLPDERGYEELDFKSRDSLAFFAEDLAFVLKYTEMLQRSDA